MSLQDKRKDLDAEKRKKLLRKLVEDLSHADPNLYYQSTSAIAKLVKDIVDKPGSMSKDDRELLAPLSQRDIEVLLSLH